VTEADIVRMAGVIQVGAFANGDEKIVPSFTKWQRDIRPTLLEKVRSILAICFQSDEAALVDMNAAVDAAKASEEARAAAQRKGAAA
jgi:hypothetical protein